MSKRRKNSRRIALALVLLVLAAAAVWMGDGIQPAVPKAAGKKVYLRFENSQRLNAVLKELQDKGLLRSALATRFLAILERHTQLVPAGSYSFNAAMNAHEVLRSLRSPITLLIRLPETNWARRSSHLLAEYQIADADEYMDLVNDPKAFAGDVDFPLPKDSLEGYLYPGRYELPPLVGAREVILRQLKAFQEHVWETPDKPNPLTRTLILASLVQLESGKDVDRPMIAGVIENRLKKKMPLQIDATILYALQKWRRLTFKDYHGVKSPYNTYTTKGLPPGPVCSPDEKDIEAAMHPAKHNYLYYVALPNGTSIYAATYKEHLKNIALRKAALLELKR